MQARLCCVESENDTDRTVHSMHAQESQRDIVMVSTHVASVADLLVGGVSSVP